ncbi:MAG: NRDE family protein [Bacteroidia bacterium]
MCLILFSYKVHSSLPLVVLANRDEFLDRPAQPAHWWEGNGGNDMLAGKDLKAGGSWLGLSRNGRFAALTNVREPHNIKADAPSRGDLVTDFLQGNIHPGEYLEKVAEKGQAYNGFNLLVGGPEELWYFGNRGPAPQKLQPGTYGLSNWLLDTPWPKLVSGKAELEALLPEISEEKAISVLKNPTTYPDDQLPTTGVPLDWERALSARFITKENYGTRCSTIVAFDDYDKVSFTVITWRPEEGIVRERFEIKELRNEVIK